MPHSMCGSGARWCARADAMFDVPDMHVLDVEIDERQAAGADGGVRPARARLPIVRGARGRPRPPGPCCVHDAPCFGRVTLVRWLKRIWRCREPACPTGDVQRDTMIWRRHGRCLTVRAVRWATDAFSHDDTTVSALARHLGVDWHTCWDAIEIEAEARVGDPARLQKVKTLGVDEHIWRPVADRHRPGGHDHGRSDP